MAPKNNILELKGFKNAAAAGLLLSRDYAGPCFRLLMNYRSISASEAASRLGLHIKTAQDFLDGLSDLGMVKKKSVREDKRPYFRYSVSRDYIRLDLDLSEFVFVSDQIIRGIKIREAKGSGAVFSEGKGHSLRSVTVYSGEGRKRVPNRISLTQLQGKFLFYLPFPTQEPETIKTIAVKAGLENMEKCYLEIFDIVQLLINYGVIEQ